MKSQMSWVRGGLAISFILLLGACGSTVSKQVASGSDNSSSLSDALGGSSPAVLTAAQVGDRVVFAAASDQGFTMASCDSGGTCAPVDVGGLQGRVPDGWELTQSGRDRALLVAAFCDQSSGHECGGSFNFEVLELEDDRIDQAGTSFDSKLLNDYPTGHLRFEAASSAGGDQAAVVIGPIGGQSALVRIDLNAKRVVSETAVPGNYRQVVMDDDGIVKVVVDGGSGASEPGLQRAEPLPAGETPDLPAPGPASLETITVDGEIKQDPVGAGQTFRSTDGHLLLLSGSGKIFDVVSGEEVGDVGAFGGRSEDSLGMDTPCSGTTLAAGSYDDKANQGEFQIAFRSGDEFRAKTLTFPGVVEALQACPLDGKLLVASISHAEAGLDGKGGSILSLQILRPTD